MRGRQLLGSTGRAPTPGCRSASTRGLESRQANVSQVATPQPRATIGANSSLSQREPRKTLNKKAVARNAATQNVAERIHLSGIGDQAVAPVPMAIIQPEAKSAEA